LVNAQVPTIDLTLPEDDIVHAVKRACETCGFLYGACTPLLLFRNYLPNSLLASVVQILT
jgi:hypothetical protein